MLDVVVSEHLNRTCRRPGSYRQAALKQKSGVLFGWSGNIATHEVATQKAQAAFPREVTAEIKGVIAGLEANKIVFAKRWNKTFVVARSAVRADRRRTRPSAFFVSIAATKCSLTNLPRAQTFTHCCCPR